jgi:hypothetical protein
MSSSLDHRWVPKSTPQSDRLYRFFTKSVGALYADLLVLFQGRDVRGWRPLVPTEEWDTARPPPRPIGGGVLLKLGGKIRKGVFLTLLFLIFLVPKKKRTERPSAPKGSSSSRQHGLGDSNVRPLFISGWWRRFGQAATFKSPLSTASPPLRSSLANNTEASNTNSSRGRKKEM